MKFISVFTAAAISASVFTSVSYSQNTVQITKPVQGTSVTASFFVSPGQCWNSWLKANGETEGESQKENGTIHFVVQASDVVHADLGSKQWVTARNALAGQLHLAALNQIATYIRQKISGTSSAGWLVPGKEASPMTTQIVGELSLAEKARRLAGLKLDDAIRKFDPTWNGAGKTDAEKRQAAVELTTRFRQAVSARAELLAAGATTVVQCEGPAETNGTATSGQYEILIGMIWTPKLAYNSQALSNSDLKIALGNDRESLAKRFQGFAASNKDWLAMTLGNRVWTDENGEMVVVGFGAAPATAVKVLDEGRAQLDAVAAIARFASESLVSNMNAKTQFNYKALKDGTSTSFDSGSYSQQIESAMKTIQLKGVYKVADWRGKHPVSGAPMQVVAYAWKPSSSASAIAAQQLLAPHTGIGSIKSGNNAVESPVKAGASGSTADY